MRLIRQLLGAACLALVGVEFVAADLASRIVLVPMIALRPAVRERRLRAWARASRVAALVTLQRVGRARFDIQPRIPCRDGILIVMNHQSLIDVLVVFQCVADGFPQVVTHARYGRGIPLVSHMIHLYGHIPVRPGRSGRSELEELAEAARTAGHPVAIFPEGHRTRDGEIRPWKRAGLESILGARPWTVYVVVVDGVWRAARITDFIRTISSVRCRAEAVGPFEYDGRDRDSHDEFVDRLNRVMCDKLSQMRGRGAADQGGRAREGAVTVS